MVGGQVRTGRDLFDMLLKFTGSDDLEEATVATWINDGLSDFPEIRFIPYREDFVDVIANTEYDLPLDFTSVVEWLYQGKLYT
jgi:hypothetical protein